MGTEAQGRNVAQGLSAINPMHPSACDVSNSYIPWAQLPWIHEREIRDRFILLNTVLQSHSRFQT